MAMLSDQERRNIAGEFHQAVNMTPATLERWLETSDSQSVGMTPDGEKVTEPGGDEAVGHTMGRRILALKAKKAAELSDDDYAAMRKVVGVRAPARQAAPGWRRDGHALAQVVDELGATTH